MNQAVVADHRKHIKNLHNRDLKPLWAADAIGVSASSEFGRFFDR